MAKKEKYIKLDKEKVKEIAEIKGVSTVTVYAALKFQTQTPLAMLIRAWALNHGGKLGSQGSRPFQRQWKRRPPVQKKSSDR